MNHPIGKCPTENVRKQGAEEAVRQERSTGCEVTLVIGSSLGNQNEPETNNCNKVESESVEICQS